MNNDADDTHKTEQEQKSKETISTKLKYLRKFVDGDANTFYESFMLIVIIVNIVSLGFETSNGISDGVKKNLLILDIICYFIFIAELIFKAIVYNKSFFAEKKFDDNHKKVIWINWWNISDLVIIIVCAFPYFSYFNVLRIFRVFRSIKVLTAFRSLRVVKAIKLVNNVSGIRRSFKAIVRAIPGIIWTFSLLAVLAYVYAIIGTNIFSGLDGDLSNYFNSIGHSFITLCQITTFDSWVSGIVRPIILMDNYHWAWIYFVSYAFTAAYVLMNVITGFIVESMQHERDKHNEKKLKKGEKNKITKDKMTIEQLSLQISDLQKQIADLQVELHNEKLIENIEKSN